jgi:hypothetical protein
MEPQVRAVKRKFNHALEPIKVMLVNRKPLLQAHEWVQFVQHTRERVMMHPHEYLGEALPEQAMIDHVVGMIFDEFLSYEGVSGSAISAHRNRASS